MSEKQEQQEILNSIKGVRIEDVEITDTYGDLDTIYLTLENGRLLVIHAYIGRGEGALGVEFQEVLDLG